MADNLKVGPNAVVPKVNRSFVDCGFTTANCQGAFKVGNPLKPWVPGNLINAIDGFEVGNWGYWIIMKQPMDLTDVVAPPIDGVVDPVDVVIFHDTFDGTAGLYSTHTPNIGTATSPNTSGMTEISLNGSGQAYFPAGLARLLPNGSGTSNITVKLIIASLTLNQAFVVILFTNASPSSLTVVLTKTDDTNCTLSIMKQATVLSTQAGIAISYPMTLLATRIGNVINASLNGANELTYTNAEVYTPGLYIQGNGGGALIEAEVKTI